jgi:membrane-bound ClpP family serine protease
MSNNCKKSESPLDALKSESARQRWELFHRAIAHAKESNNASLLEADTHGGEVESTGPLLSIIR